MTEKAKPKRKRGPPPGYARGRRRQDVYDFIVRFMVTNSYPPSMRDICTEFDFAAPNAATNHVRSLVADGLLRQTTHRTYLPVNARVVIDPQPGEKCTSDQT